MKALFDTFNPNPFMLCYHHYEDTFPANTFPYCGEYEGCMFRYIPSEVIVAIQEKYGFLPDPIKYENRLSSMDSIAGTIKSIYGLPRSWIIPWKPLETLQHLGRQGM